MLLLLYLCTVVFDSGHNNDFGASAKKGRERVTSKTSEKCPRKVYSPCALIGYVECCEAVVPRVAKETTTSWPTSSSNLTPLLLYFTTLRN
jgi:hypothetical protein